MKTAMLYCILFAAFVAAAEATTPLAKVTALLEGLKTSLDAEGEEEAKSYGKFACFCKDATESKSKSITKGQDFIDTTSANIAAKSAKKEEKTAKQLEQKQKVEAVTAKLEKAKELHRRDKATFEANHLDLTKAVGSTRRSLKALTAATGGPLALLDLGSNSDVSKSLDFADALGLALPNKEHLMSSLAMRQTVDPTDPEYRSHSGKIMEIISTVEKDFTKKRDDAMTEWEKTDASAKAEQKSMEKSIDTAKKATKTLAGDIGKLQADISRDRVELINSQSLLQDDSKYLSELTMRCENKGRDWDQRSKMRGDEVKAIASALEILTGTVKKADAVNARASLLAKVAPKSEPLTLTKSEIKPEAKSLIEVNEKVQGFLSKIDRVQVSSATVQDRMSEFLHHEGMRLKSATLSSLASQIQADPFREVSKLVQGLITRLLEESKQEATKTGFCGTELAKSYATRDARLSEVNKLDTESSALEAKEDVLTSQIQEAKDDVTELVGELKKATDLRKSGKAESENTLKTAQEGSKAVAESLVLLRDFYKTAGKAASLSQISASPVDEDKKNPGSGFDGVYKGSQDSSKAILGLLETIKSDFERTLRTTKAAEDADAKEFVTFERTSKADIAGKNMKVVLDEQDLASTKAAIGVALEDMKTAMDLLDGALKNVELLKPTCLDTGMSYKERVGKRDQEMSALKSALNMLDDKK